MTCRLAVVAHQSRAGQAHQLMEDVSAAYMHMDNGKVGCEHSHLKAWRYHEKHTTEPWSVVLEDDAEPVEGFRNQLDQALAVAPTPIVGLYLGTSTPPHWQRPIRQAIAQADQQQAHWIVTHTVINAVGLAIRTDLLAELNLRFDKPIDEALAQWVKLKGHHVAYSLPSLVDHRDDEPVIKKRADGGKRTQPRKAWRTGTRDTWTSKSVEMMPVWANIA